MVLFESGLILVFRFFHEKVEFDEEVFFEIYDDSGSIPDPIEDNNENSILDIPKNLVCTAHTLQLCLKDVFEKNDSMLAVKE